MIKLIKNLLNYKEYIMKKILITLLCFFTMLPAFASFKTVITKCMNSWKGYSINDVISTWGYPTRKNEFAGKKLYYWEQSQSYIYGNRYGVYGGTDTCTRILEVNNNDEVVGWEVKGNACPSTYCGVKKWVNPINNPWIIEKKQKQEIKFQKKQEKELIKQYKKELFL